VLAGLGGGTEAEMSNPEYAPGTPGVAGAIAAAGCAGTRPASVRAWRYRPDMPTDHPAGQDRMTRPRVIVSVTATADGRVTLSRTERLLDDGPKLRWKATWPPDVGDLLARRAAAIEQRHHPTVVLEGSGTFVADDAGALRLPDTSVPADVLRTDFLPYRSPRWFAVVDARGRVAWTHRGDEETSLLVIASRGTPLPYLAHLRHQRIPYLLTGARRVDLTSALVRIGTQLGAECVVSEAGGGLNGALLRAGLVDELHIVTVPALIGGLGTPSIMDGPPLGTGSPPEQLRAIDVQVGAHGTIWAHYEVVAR
jgi:2,5-diamino-6-(ribosylamino)-4(3H)-pyrimidinone 5'-phosphate reductase